MPRKCIFPDSTSQMLTIGGEKFSDCIWNKQNNSVMHPYFSKLWLTFHSKDELDNNYENYSDYKNMKRSIKQTFSILPKQIHR